jgi:hypothetical protein
VSGKPQGRKPRHRAAAVIQGAMAIRRDVGGSVSRSLRWPSPGRAALPWLAGVLQRAHTRAAEGLMGTSIGDRAHAVAGAAVIRAQRRCAGHEEPPTGGGARMHDVRGKQSRTSKGRPQRRQRNRDCSVDLSSWIPASVSAVGGGCTFSSRRAASISSRRCALASRP